MTNPNPPRGTWAVAAAPLVILLASAPASATSFPITIVPSFDSTITSDANAATIEATIKAAVTIYEHDLASRHGPVTAHITFKEMTSGLGQSSWYYTGETYTNYRAALVTSATSPDDTTALPHLPATATNPVNGSSTVNLQDSLARALGFNANPPGGTDGTVSLNTGIMNLSRASTDASKFDLMSVAMHEIDEVLGFGSALNGLANGAAAPTGAIWPEDLFRYGPTGSRSFSTGVAVVNGVSTLAYFSLDGTTDLAQFNEHAGGDFSDWYSFYGGVTPQVQDAYSTRGAAPNLGVELRALDAIGYTLVPEPHAWMLVASGMATVVALRRAGRRARQP